MATLLETIKSSSLTARRYSNHNNSSSNSNNTKEEEGEEETTTTTTIITTTFHLQGIHAEDTVSEVLEAVGYNMTVFEPLNNGL
ncbi:MAG TPA: hypothetical protein VHF65_03025 [Nitrososphaera sp.]|nr:hypothetical protein [Nitrososphaera sp.]